MLIIADKRIPQQAFYKLKKIGYVVTFEAPCRAYPAISSHPDVFCCRTGDEMVIAPNTPENIKQQLHQNHVHFGEGELNVGEQYPKTAHYNAVVTDKLLIHNLKHTDRRIHEKCAGLEHIHVNQAYTRCNLIPLINNRFITSDQGIEKVLIREGFGVLFVHPEGILLPGFAHGFIGGTCGIHKNKIFFIGSLNHHPEGDKISNFLSGMEIIELYDGPLFDGGSLIFVDY